METLHDIHNCFSERPILIAGPCSAESEEQVLQTAMALAAMQVNVFRAGIWKPRTRPGSFEGVGIPGLKWLQKVKTETGMMTATEVATPEHVFAALKFDVDILWIGARTTVNPFAMQQISESLSGVDIPVLVKNPVNPDIDLWIGGIERLHAAGIRKLGAIHRGFSDFKEKVYRNAPHWEIAIELKRRIPELPIICDPSHMGGKRELIMDLSQRSLDMGFDGLIIEVHPDPDKALSDSLQQLSVSGFDTLIHGLCIRKPEPDNPAAVNELNELRKKIDLKDRELIRLMAERMELAEKIGLLKKENNITIVQNKRWDEIFNKRMEQGEQLNLSKEFIRNVFEAIHEESIYHQIRIMNVKR